MRNIIHAINETISEQIRNDIQYNWREETVVLNLLTRLRQLLNNKTINYNLEPYKINFRLFQAFGGIETNFGDISLIIRLVYPDGEQLEGVGFIEAKIRKKKTFRFESIRVNQLRRINSNAPRALLLLLDYESVSFNHFDEMDYYHHRTFSTNSLVTQINTSLALNKKDTSLYKISFPFAIQLVDRYFNGLDLEFSEKSLKIAKGYAEDKGFPKHTIFLTLSPEKTEYEFSTDINENKYKEIK
jgi:hypothetical protein